MSMTSDPTEKTSAYAAFAESHKGKSLTSFGSAFNATGTKRFELWGCPDAHEMSAALTTGTGTPGIEYTKMLDFDGAHRGHQLTHLGSMISDKGSRAAWYCQTDDKMCYDTKS